MIMGPGSSFACNYQQNKAFTVRINNLDKHTLNRYTLPCIELGIATAPR